MNFEREDYELYYIQNFLTDKIPNIILNYSISDVKLSENLESYTLDNLIDIQNKILDKLDNKQLYLNLLGMKINRIEDLKKLGESKINKIFDSSNLLYSSFNTFINNDEKISILLNSLKNLQDYEDFINYNINKIYSVAFELQEDLNIITCLINIYKQDELIQRDEQYAQELITIDLTYESEQIKADEKFAQELINIDISYENEQIKQDECYAKSL